MLDFGACQSRHPPREGQIQLSLTVSRAKGTESRWVEMQRRIGSDAAIIGCLLNCV